MPVLDPESTAICPTTWSGRKYFPCGAEMALGFPAVNCSEAESEELRLYLRFTVGQFTTDSSSFTMIVEQTVCTVMSWNDVVSDRLRVLANAYRPAAMLIVPIEIGSAGIEVRCALFNAEILAPDCDGALQTVFERYLWLPVE